MLRDRDVAQLEMAVSSWWKLNPQTIKRRGIRYAVPLYRGVTRGLLRIDGPQLGAARRWPLGVRCCPNRGRAAVRRGRRSTRPPGGGSGTRVPEPHPLLATVTAAGGVVNGERGRTDLPTTYEQGVPAPMGPRPTS